MNLQENINRIKQVMSLNEQDAGRVELTPELINDLMSVARRVDAIAEELRKYENTPFWDYDEYRPKDKLNVFQIYRGLKSVVDRGARHTTNAPSFHEHLDKQNIPYMLMKYGGKSEEDLKPAQEKSIEAEPSNWASE